MMVSEECLSDKINKDVWTVSAIKMAKKIRIVCKIMVGVLQGKTLLEENGMIILNWILKEQDVTVSRIGYSILML
jgi:hypothetical protein